MNRSVTAIFLCLAATPTFAQPNTEPLLKKLPPWIPVKSTVSVNAAQLDAFGKRLGGSLVRLTNSFVQVHGREIKVNVIVAADDDGAAAIHAGLLKIKPHPFVVRQNRAIVEYVGADEALALKTSYELGVLPKPKRVRYRVTAEIATVDEADYMACQPLFDKLRNLKGEADDSLADLTKRFKFGKSLALRNPEQYCEPAKHRFKPSAERAEAGVYTFANPPSRHGVPFVVATLDVATDESGRYEAPAPANELTAATKFWPVEDAEVQKLAKRIAAGKSTADAKAQALLVWLAPGRNVKYAGQQGSRYGTRKVLEQKFGHCWDFSDAFVTLARAMGVPARQTAGWLYGASGHVWAEYHDGKSWRQVDPTGADRLPCGIYHIPYFATDDGAMPIVYLSMPKIEMSKD